MARLQDKEQPTVDIIERPGIILLFAVWFGLFTGFAEVIILAVKKFLLHQYINLGPDIIWMAPVSDLLIFFITGLILFLLARLKSRFVSLKLVNFVFTFLVILGLLLMWPRLRHYTILLLIAGIAVQTANIIATRAQGFYFMVQRTTRWMITAVVGLILGMYIFQGLSERRAIAEIPAAPSNAPNVLLIVLDTVRAQSLSLCGYNRNTTPQLKQYAKTGVLFNRALQTSSWTTPSHASMFTGRFHHELTVDWEKPLDESYHTLAEFLSSQGYITAGFVANIEYCSYETGLDRGFIHYEDYLVNPWEIILSSSLGRVIANHDKFRRIYGYYDIFGRKTAAKINRYFLTWLSHKKNRPFFVFLNYYDAHEPYLPPEPYDVKFASEAPRKNFLIRYGIHQAVRTKKEEMSPQEIQAELDAYEGSIAYTDNQLGVLLTELRKRRLLDQTLVIITSDHGEQFGDHGLFTHGNSLYLQTLFVPLLISFPSRVPSDIIVQEPVTLRDLAATVVDVLNLETTADFPGTSLERYWDSSNDRQKSTMDPLLSEVNFAPRQPAWYPIYKGDMKSLMVGQYHYIRNGDGQEELYDFENDPKEENDLAHSENGIMIIKKFRKFMEVALD